MLEPASPLCPLTSPSPDTFVLGDRSFVVGETIAPTAAEQLKLTELKAFYEALRAQLDRLYQRIHGAVRTWMPELHVDYHAYARAWAMYRRAVEDLVWAVQDRLGCALPIGVNLVADAPHMFVRPAGRDDAPALTVPAVAEMTQFKRKAEEPRALAMALADAFHVEAANKVTFSLLEWDQAGISYFSAATPPQLLDVPARRTEAMTGFLSRMLADGGVGRSLLIRSQADPRSVQVQLMPTLLLVVTDRTTYVASFRGVSGWEADAPPDSELAIIRRMLRHVGSDDVRAFVLIRHPRSLPADTLQEDEKAPKKTGFVVTYVTAAPQTVLSDVYVHELGREGSLKIVHRRALPGVVAGALFSAQDLLDQFAP